MTSLRQCTRDPVWALVLAAGEGSRLPTAGRSGTSVPKQFCSLRAKSMLVEEGIEYASTVAMMERTCVLFAEGHKTWWQPLSARIACKHIVQPSNRGTGMAVLYATMRILARDPKAHVVILPGDQFAQYRQLFQRGIEELVQLSLESPDTPVLIGVQPDDAHPELGYIVPAADGDAHAIERFVEKASGKAAAELLRQGALWNTFILAASARALIDRFFAPRYSAVVAQIGKGLESLGDPARAGAGWSDFKSIYQRFPVVDLFCDVLAERRSQLRVVKVAACGWSALADRNRVAAILGRKEVSPAAPEIAGYA